MATVKCEVTTKFVTTLIVEANGYEEARDRVMRIMPDRVKKLEEAQKGLKFQGYDFHFSIANSKEALLLRGREEVRRKR